MSSETEKPHLNTSFDINLPVKVTGQDIEDILVTAFEGGIGYWCRTADVIEESTLTPEPDEPTSVFLARALITDGAIVLHDGHESDPRKVQHRMWLADFITGVQRWVQLRAKQTHRGVGLDDGRLDTGNIDAEDADVIVQYATFMGVRYG